MPQFDILTLNSQIISLIMCLILFYFYNVKITILYFAKIKKFRTKKLAKTYMIIQNTQIINNNSLWFINNKYKKLYQNFREYNLKLVKYIFCKYNIVGSNPIISTKTIIQFFKKLYKLELNQQPDS